MYKVTTLSEYGHRNGIEYSTLTEANYYFNSRQTKDRVMVCLFENDTCIKIAEKIANKWYVSVR